MPHQFQALLQVIKQVEGVKPVPLAQALSLPLPGWFLPAKTKNFKGNFQCSTCRSKTKTKCL
jgi:hypothetical protein